MIRRAIFMAIVAAPLSSDVLASTPQQDLGKQVFQRWCAACHAPGPRHPGTSALAAKYGDEKPAPLEMRQDLTPEIVHYFVRSGVSIMPSFRKTEISDSELDALGGYLGTKNKK